ncbi:MAG: hypothetical protein LC793_16280 [Thermomicrobia bacterium]|nr:hypothetical protein [Thermomicrobia bacterium]MCA1723026.1 hypothetical protein [Thermomicrobia bacterium]
MTYQNLLTLGRRCRIVYRAADGEITERVIDVERVYTSGTGATVVVAFCHRRGATRTFNAANILAAMPDDSTVTTTFGQMRVFLPFTGQRTDSASRLAGWN